MNYILYNVKTKVACKCQYDPGCIRDFGKIVRRQFDKKSKFVHN